MINRLDKKYFTDEALKKGLVNNKFKIKKWKLLSTFIGDSSINGLPCRVMVFTTGRKKYFGISTQIYRFNKNDKSGKYIFKLIETNLP